MKTPSKTFSKLFSIVLDPSLVLYCSDNTGSVANEDGKGEFVNIIVKKHLGIISSPEKVIDCNSTPYKISNPDEIFNLISEHTDSDEQLHMHNLFMIVDE